MQAFAWHWSVSLRTVHRWKTLLGLHEVTPGTLETTKRSRAEAMRILRDPALQKGVKPIPTKELLRRRASSPAEIRSMENRGMIARAWTKPELKLLGTAPDKEIGMKLNRSEMAVRQRRTLLGIPKVGEYILKPWTNKEHKLLGVLPDEEVAELTKRTPEAVVARRELFNIHSANPKVKVWTPEELKLLGTLPDAEVAKILNRPLKGVWSRRVKDRKLFSIRKNLAEWEIRLLGTMPDDELAQKLNRTVISVANSRRKRGIPPVSGKDGGRTWTQEEVALLGTIPDEEVAKRTGRPLVAIAQARFKRNIPKPNPKYRLWTTEEDCLIKANLPTKEISQLTDRTRVAVNGRRRDLKLPNPDRRFWTTEQEKLLGTIPDEELATRTGFTLKQIRKKRSRRKT